MHDPHHHHPPATMAGAIIAHYLRNLTIGAGRRWTAANDRDMARLTELLDELGAIGESIPAFTPAPAPAEAAPERAVPDPAKADPRFADWREARRSAEEDGRSIGRMIGRGKQP